MRCWRLWLAQEPSLLSSYRQRLGKNRPTAPLFDTDRFRRHIEQAYTDHRSESMTEASLLHAVGLAELVTRSLEEYEALAFTLANQPSLLRRFRKRLERNRPTAPLFDADRFRRHLEQAYATMLDIERRGEKPRSFSVDPTPTSGGRRRVDRINAGAGKRRNNRG